MDQISRDAEFLKKQKMASRFIDIGLSAVNQGIIVIDTTQQILAVNEAFKSISGFSEDECVGRGWDLLTGPNFDPEVQKKIRHSFHNVSIFSGDVESCRKDGSMFWSELLVKPIFNKARKLKYFIWVINDISKHKALEEELNQLAYTDELTKLFTRRVLEDRLGLAQLKSQRTKQYAALFSIDLDHFKRINDLFGHSTGDLRLIDVAKRLKECVRDDYTVARIGGDEFFILINELSPNVNKAKKTVDVVAQRLVERLSAKSFLCDIQRKPCELADVSQCSCSASIGVVLFSGKDRATKELFEQADHAMYEAKHIGGNSYRISEVDVDTQDKSNDIYLLGVDQMKFRVK